MIFYVVSILLLLISANCNAQAVTEAEAAKKSLGLILFNQYKPAELELRAAAEAGDSEAQFYLAEEVRQKNQYITPEAKKWLEAASSQGDFYALLILARSDNDLCAIMNNCSHGSQASEYWTPKLMQLASESADKGNAEALYIMYELTAERDWLQKSALAGNSTAQYRMAIGDRQGEGFLLPWKRQNSVEKWFLLSAKGGNPKAMMQLFGIYREKGDLEQARYWVEKAASISYEAGIYNLGYFLALDPSALGFKENKIKGYALISLLKELDGGGTAQTDVAETLPLISEKMTTAEINEARKYATKWKASHSPLSFFPEKIGF
jgi:TPR repeat protein